MAPTLIRLLGLACLALLLIACDDDDKVDAQLPPNTDLMRIGDLVFADRGTRDVSALTEVGIEAGQYYFAPTFLRGRPGQRLALTVTNTDEDLVHNVSLPAQEINRDIPIGGAELIEVVFPQSGALLFFCTYHASYGMNGELLVGDATPQPQ